MNIIIKNKKANFEYEIVDKYVAGMKLLGSEVKSLRNSNASISEAYCYMVDGELFIKGMHITEYTQSGKYQNHDPLRERKLLLTKKELEKLFKGVGQKGFTIIPLNVHLTERGLFKMEIGLGRGKKLYDKKMTIKQRDLDRDIKNNY